MRRESDDVREAREDLETEDRRVMRLWIGIGLVLVVLLAIGLTAMPARAAEFSGRASFYGNESGSRTASGQRFDQNKLTAAHRSLPFGTRLRVSRAGYSVNVVINDRGPFIAGRVLDLSTAAARALRMIGAGVAVVHAEVLR